MKNIKVIFLLCCALWWFSCEKPLELQPTESLPTKEALSDMPAVRTALYGVYHTMQSGSYGQQLYIAPEAEGNLVYYAKLDPVFDSNYSGYNYTPSKIERDIWNKSYAMIFQTNNILNNIDRLKDPVGEKNQIKGEALALRALSYFNLVRFFAEPYTAGNPAADPGVPIVLGPGNNEPARNTVAEVYDRIIADLQAAKAILGDADRFRFSANGAEALLARVYLYKGDMGAAESAASTLLSSGKYALADDVVALFATTGNSEEIFTLKFEASENAAGWSLAAFYNPPAGARGLLAVSSDLISLYEAGDTRLNLIYEQSGVKYQSKFKSQDGVTGLYSPKLLRLAEMYLIRAEARFQQRPDDPGVLDDLNMLRRKRGATEWSSLPNGILDILHERQRELAFEGHTIFDYWRTGTDMVRTDPNHVDPKAVPASDKCKILHPIPQSEMNANKNMVQNGCWR